MADAAAPALVADPPTTPAVRPWRRRLVVALPDLLVPAVSGFTVGPMALLIAGHFDAVLAVPLGLLGALIACRIAAVPTTHVTGRDARWSVLATLFALSWFAYNVHYTAEDVYATRDPAAFTLTGQWLVHHATLQIPTHPEIFGNPPGGQGATGSFAIEPGAVLNAQGDHLMQMILGLSGRLFGTTALLATNTALTTLALLVFFGLARRIVGPIFGFAAMAALGLSMPLIYTGRDAYTEPLTMLFLMGALTYLHRGMSTRRPADWAIAGLAAGSATGVRVDSYGALIGMALAATLFVAVATVERRRGALRCAAALAAGAALPLLLGWLDLTRLSRQYFGAQHSNITHLLALLAVVLVLSPVIVRLAWTDAVRRRLGTARMRARTSQGLVVLLVAVFGALATRPWWQRTHGAFSQDLVNMQRRWGAAVCGNCTYNEQTVHWLALYVGWPTVILAVLGYAVLITRLVRDRRYELAGVLATGLSMSALYLWTSQVAPDQPWAMRRYVPVILPLLLVAAAAALRAAFRARRRPTWVRPLVVVGVLVLIGYPLRVSMPMRHVRDEVPQLRQLDAICAAVGTHGAVVITDDATVFGYGQAMRSFCNVPEFGVDNPSAQTLSAVRAAVAAHGRTLFVLTQDVSTVPLAPPGQQSGQKSNSPPYFSRVSVSRWPNQINKAPKEPDHQYYGVYLGPVTGDGQVELLPPVTPGS